jgi:hypothetical protein
MMMTVFLWTNNINVPCKPPTHVFEGKVRQKKWGQYTSKYGIHMYTYSSYGPRKELSITLGWQPGCNLQLVFVYRFLKEEPDRLEGALRRCKKLTGTLVTLKRCCIVLFHVYSNSSRHGFLVISTSI